MQHRCQIRAFPLDSQACVCYNSCVKTCQANSSASNPTYLVDTRLLQLGIESPSGNEAGPFFHRSFYVCSMSVLTPEEKAKRDARKAFLNNLSNRQRLAFAFFTLFHSQGRRLVYWRGSWWQWSATHYTELDRQSLKSVLSKFIESEFSKAGEGKPNLTRAILADVLELLESRCTADANRDAPFSLTSAGTSDRQHISLANGVLDVHTAVEGGSALFPHDPEWFSLAALPFSYQPDAVCPRWDAFLQETFEGDVERIAFMEEWMGYCCVYDYSYQHAVILTGEGANGKGVLTKVLVGLVGPENVSHVPLEMFGEKFQLVPTIGKLLNTAPEISTIDKQDEEQLKAVTGADRLTIDTKYGKHRNTAITARLMFSTNELPIFQDSSGGLKRRLIIVPFNRVVPEVSRDPNLPAALLAELPGIFNRALAGLRRLKQRGSFSIPEISRMTLERHMLECKPAQVFLADFTVKDASVACSSQDLYAAYREWILEQGYHRDYQLSLPAFVKEVERVHKVRPAQMLRGDSPRLRFYRGLRALDLSSVRMVTV